VICRRCICGPSADQLGACRKAQRAGGYNVATVVRKTHQFGAVFPRDASLHGACSGLVRRHFKHGNHKGRRFMKKLHQKAQNFGPKRQWTPLLGWRKTPKRKSRGSKAHAGKIREKNPDAERTVLEGPRRVTGGIVPADRTQNEQIQRSARQRGGRSMPPTPAITPKRLDALCGTDQGQRQFYIQDKI